MRSTILYIIGFGLVGFGFYEAWRDGTVDQQAFLIGGVCIAAAAALQVVRDIWRRLHR